MKVSAIIFFLSLAPGALHAQRQVPPGTRVERDLVYSRAGTRELALDLYLPANSSGPLPVVAHIHGGGWQSGSKANVPMLFLLSRGYAVVSIDYRLTGEAVFPAQIHDCKAAIRWLRANAVKYNLDPERIGVFGSSAGGHLAALLGTSGGVAALEGSGGNPGFSSRVKAVVEHFGPTDLTMGDPGHLTAGSPEGKLIGGAILENKDKVALANPIAFIKPDSPPFRIAHGDRDAVVPLRESQALHDALRSAGVESTFEIRPGEGHAFPIPPPLQQSIAEFFDRHLKEAVKP